MGFWRSLTELCSWRRGLQVSPCQQHTNEGGREEEEEEEKKKCIQFKIAPLLPENHDWKHNMLVLSKLIRFFFFFGLIINLNSSAESC